MSVKEHPAKAESPILIVFLVIVTLESALQPLKALSPILITDLGIDSDVMPVHPLKVSA
jgi:hypothetical protein